MNHRLLLFLWTCLPLMAAAQAVYDIPLNEGWKFVTADSTAHYADGLPADAQSVSIPHTWNVEPGLEEYAGIAWYQRDLQEINSSHRGQTIRLHFRGVYHSATVWVNGQQVGEHLYAGYTPFSFDITPYLSFQPGADNRLTVRVDNSYSENNLPYRRSFDWANDGGIYRPVSLHVSQGRTIRYVHVTPDINLTDSTAVAHFDIRLHESDIRRTTCRITIRDHVTQRLIHQSLQELRRQTDGTFRCQADCHKVHLWHFDQPHLYTFTVEVLHRQQICDSRTERFGFRRFTVEGNRFSLNGEPVRLQGIEDMPGSHPDYGMAEPPAHMLQTTRTMKRLNCAITRYHWPQDDYRLQLTDSLGILVQEELPWWQQPQTELSPALRESARRQLTELIEAHYNHPSIYAWGVSNEVRNNTAEIKCLAQCVHSADSTRLVLAMGNRIWQNLENDPPLALDLPTWNEYTGTWHGNDRNQLPEHFANIGKVLGNRPLFITEGGLCEPAFTGGDTRRVDEMLFHVNHWKAQPFVCGFIYFCLQDYRTQMGEEGYGKYRIRRHGVTQADLTPKASYNMLRQLCSPLLISEVKPSRSQRDNHTLAGVYAVHPDDHDVSVALTVSQSIPCYVLRGYTIRYTDATGTLRSVSLPHLHPGETYTFVLPEINPQYHFAIYPPQAEFPVIDY